MSTINRKTFQIRLLFSILIIAGMSYVLRPSIESTITLFRVLMPLIFLYFCFKRSKEMMIVLWMSLILFIYNFFVSSFVSRFNEFSYVFYFYSVILLFWYYFTKYTVEVATPLRVYNFLTLLFKAMIVLGFIQLIFGGQYPNTPIRAGEIIIFFPNGNEYAAVLAGFMPLYFLREKGYKKFFWIASTIFFVVYNDARLSLIAVSFFFLAYGLMKLPIMRFGKLGLILAVTAVFSIALIVKDHEIFGGLILNDLLFKPLIHIFTLTPVEHIGSINSRLNAVIFGTQELIGSYFWGIGLGNSHLMMAEHIVESNEGGVAHSMHNFVYQIITELGWLGAIYLISIYNIVKISIKENTKYNHGVIWMYYVFMTLNITLLSGPFSNYFFLFIFFYSIFHFRYNI